MIQVILRPIFPVSDGNGIGQPPGRDMRHRQIQPREPAPFVIVSQTLRVGFLVQLQKSEIAGVKIKPAIIQRFSYPRSFLESDEEGFPSIVIDQTFIREFVLSYRILAE